MEGTLNRKAVVNESNFLYRFSVQGWDDYFLWRCDEVDNSAAVKEIIIINNR